MPNERSDDTPPASPDACPVFVDVMAAFSEASLRLRPAVNPGKTHEADDTGEAEAVEALAGSRGTRTPTHARQWWAARCAVSTSSPKSAAGSRQTEWAWLAPRWVLSHSTSSRGPCSR